MKQIAIVQWSPIRSSQHRPRVVRSSVWIVGAALAATATYLLVTNTGARSQRRETTQPAQRILIASAMSLSAKNADGAVHITWDGTAPLIRAARVGILSVKDG